MQGIGSPYTGSGAYHARHTRGRDSVKLMSRPFQPIWVLHATVILAALASVPLTVAQLEGEDTPFMVAADWVIWTIFVVDFLVMLTLARRGEQLRRSWFSAVLVVLTFPAIPALLHGLRIARVARLLPR